MTAVDAKSCRVCGVEKSLDEFPRDATLADGRQTRCSVCSRDHWTTAKRKYRARLRGESPSNDFDIEEPTQPDSAMPSQHFESGRSTLVDADGNVKLQWVKTKRTEEQYLAGLVEAAREELAAWRGVAPPSIPPTSIARNTLAAYCIGDPHVGLYAWPDETGSDGWDLQIAEDCITDAIDRAVAAAPPAEQALLVILGDNYHADSPANTTTAGTRVDVDTRWAKVLGVGIRIWRRAIDRALQKHAHVYVIPERGNHDDMTGMMLAILLKHVYENEPRVTIDASPSKFHYHRFGVVLLGVTHGDTCKHDRLPAVMAADRARDWGETTYRHWLVGHVHHSSIKEHPGCTVETFPTLAPRDAWHAAAGYRASRSMSVLVFDRDVGLVARHVIGIESLRTTRRNDLTYRWARPRADFPTKFCAVTGSDGGGLETRCAGRWAETDTAESSYDPPAELRCARCVELDREV